MNPIPNRDHPLKRLSAILATWATLGLIAACSTLPPAAPSAEQATPAPNVAAVSAPSVETAPAPAAKLGTQWGEGRESRVKSIRASRLTPDRPDAIASIAYTNAAALKQLPQHTKEQRLNLQLAQGDIEWAIHDEKNRPMTLSKTADTQQFQLGGTQGARYTLVFRNLSNHAYEVIATVDGLDVLNGQAGSLRNGGYVLHPYRTLEIEGFRKSKEEVAAFRFSAPERAYAANTPAGDVRNIGILGAAIFRLDLPDAPRKVKPGQPDPFPGDSESTYAPPPRY